MVRVAINAWFLNQLGTGSGQYLQGLLRHSADAPALELLLVAPADRFSGAAEGDGWEERSLEGQFWQSHWGKVVFEQVAFPRICRQWGADVAHVPYWGSAWYPRLPTVVTVHDVIPLRLPAYRGGLGVRLYTRLVSASARRATRILTDSNASKDDIARYLHVPQDRIQCIYLGAGEHLTARAQPDDQAIREQYHLDRSKNRYILYLAGHDVRKNVENLIMAYATVAQSDDDVSLVVGGKLPRHNTPPWFDPRPLVSELGLEHDVRFIGWVDEAHKPALYRGAACAVFPSRYEGFGLPVLEALACGTPVITSNQSSLPELLGDAGFALDPDDVDGLAGAMVACLVDPDLSAELRRRGPKQAARFSWAQTARETFAAYKEAASCAS